MIQVRIASLSVDSRSNSPVLVLMPLVVDPAHPRLLPIWIGTPEATSILLALQGADMPRPLTHDLMKNVVETLGFVIERVEITRVDEGTFYAALILRGEESAFAVDARPSDSIALAVRTGSPIYVDDDVFEQASIEAEPDVDADEEVEQFREFLNSIEPEDFLH